MAHVKDINELCRICAESFQSKYKSMKKYSCCDFENQLKSCFKIIITPNDPTYFCNSCYAFMTNCLLKQSRISNKFVVRKLSKHNDNDCNTCKIFNNAKQIGRPAKSKPSYLTEYDFASKTLVPLEDTNTTTCGICCNVLAPQSQILPCGHMECSQCTYRSGDSIKCAKCCNICKATDVMELSASLVLGVIVKCSHCLMEGVHRSMLDHTCGSKSQIDNITVAELLSTTSDDVALAATKVAAKWVPELAKDGVLQAKSNNKV